MAADVTLVQSTQNLAAAKSLRAKSAAEGFAKGFSKSAEKIASLVEQSIQKKKDEDRKILEFADQRTNIDMSAVTDPQYRGAITNFLTEGKKTYAQGANLAVANSEDPFGEGYTEGKNLMQGVNDHTAVAVKQIARFDQMRNTFDAEIRKNGKLPEGLSNSERKIATDIFKGGADMKIDPKTGKISFKVAGEEPIDLDTYKFPTDDLPQVLEFDQKQTANVLNSGRAMTEGQVVAATAGYAKMLETRSSVVGILKERRGDISFVSADADGAAPMAGATIEVEDPTQQRTATEQAYDAIYKELERSDVKNNGEYTPEALKKAAKKTAELMAKDLQAKSMEQYQGSLRYSESYNALENEGKTFRVGTYEFKKRSDGKYVINENGLPMGIFDSISDVKKALPKIATQLK